jgi:thioredoxin-like negative regulator of GroEL
MYAGLLSASRRFLGLAAVWGALVTVGPQSAVAQATDSQTTAEARTLAHVSRLERAGRLAEARSLLEDMLERYPTSFNGLVTLRRILETLGETGGLIPFAERAVTQSGATDDLLLQVWIRALASVGRADSARAAAEGWVARAPSEPSAYIELAFAERQAGNGERAVEVLLEGRERVGDSEVFTQELAQLLMEAGRFDEAAVEWTRMLSWGQVGSAAVERSLAQLRGDSFDAAVDALWRTLTAGAVSFTAAQAGLQLGFSLGDPERVLLLARGLVATVPGDARLALLRDFVLEARNRDMLQAAGWAAARLAAESPTPGERLQWHAVVAEIAYQTGDTATARDAFEALAREAEVGSEAHRVATRRLFSLRSARPEEAEALLREYSRLYPESEPELAQMAVELSRAYAAAGKLSAASRTLDLLPATPSDAAVAALIEEQRGRLALYAGDIETARASLAVAVAIPGASPARRTETIALFDALSQADSAESVSIGRTFFALLRDPKAVSAESLIEEWAASPDAGSRAKLAALTATELQEAGRPDEASALRRWLIGTYPDAPEAAPALLNLARSAMKEDPELARHYLETLVVDHPESAVAPLGRRLLAELNGRVPKS